MERSGFIRSQWALSETNRRAKFYLLTPAGKKHLLVAERSWADVVKGVQAVLRFA
jgi:PadR family transcriptional regulator, regulatory protein PadR